MSKENRLEWDTVLIVLIICILFVLFAGTPDIADAIIFWMTKGALQP